MCKDATVCGPADLFMLFTINRVRSRMHLPSSTNWDRSTRHH